jgi:alcohol dehydrogenase
MPANDVMHKPRPILAAAISLASSAGRAAGAVALARHRGARLRRLVDVAADATQQRRRPTRKRMRSLVAAPGGRLHWRDTATPRPPGPLGATVGPLAMATCDIDRPVALGATMFPLPLHFGHECVAEVLAVGEAVQTVRPGDRVVVPFQINCGGCAACWQGFTGNCRAVPPLSMYGFGVAGGAWGGVFAEQVAVPFADAMLVPLPSGIDPAAAASAADTLSDAYRHIAPHLERVRRHPEGPSIIIVGAVRPDCLFSGSMPLYAGLVARALGHDISVSLVDARPWIRAHADRLGLDTMTPRQLRHCSAPLVVDCSTEPRGLALAVRATAPDGLCSSAGTLHATARIPATLMFARNVTLSVARSHARDVVPEVLTLIADGRLRPGDVTTRLAPFEDAPTALRDHLTGTDTKTVLVR